MINSAYQQHEALKNKLLAALPRGEFERLLPSLEAIALPLGITIYEPNTPMDYVYFPTTSLISMLYTTREGITTEIGLHGSDGVVGLAVYLGGVSMPHQAVVMIAGIAYRMKADSVQREFSQNGCFQTLLLRFTLSLITQISQTAVCNRLHSVEQHFCRWLLETRDRLQSDNFCATQEIVARMLGVRREAISLAASRLQEKNLIAYKRGTITILDGAKIEAFVCECYRTALTEYNRLLG